MSAPTIDNKVALLVLQHPQEQDRALGTASLLVQSLAHATLTVGLSWRNLAHALKRPAEPKDWGVLYLGSAHATKELGPLVALDRKGTPVGDQERAQENVEGLVVLDGNWGQAKALWWRNPWLTKLRRFVVVPDAPSLYGDLRREARPDAVSTLEAAALALSVLEGNAAMREKLHAAFRAFLAEARAAGVREVKVDRRKRR